MHIGGRPHINRTNVRKPGQSRRVFPTKKGQEAADARALIVERARRAQSMRVSSAATSKDSPGRKRPLSVVKPPLPINTSVKPPVHPTATSTSSKVQPNPYSWSWKEILGISHYGSGGTTPKGREAQRAVKKAVDAVTTAPDRPRALPLPKAVETRAKLEGLPSAIARTKVPPQQGITESTIQNIVNSTKVKRVIARGKDLGKEVSAAVLPTLRDAERVVTAGINRVSEHIDDVALTNKLQDEWSAMEFGQLESSRPPGGVSRREVTAVIPKEIRAQILKHHKASKLSATTAAPAASAPPPLRFGVPPRKPKNTFTEEWYGQLGDSQNNTYEPRQNKTYEPSGFEKRDRDKEGKVFSDWAKSKLKTMDTKPDALSQGLANLLGVKVTPGHQVADPGGSGLPVLTTSPHAKVDSSKSPASAYQEQKKRKEKGWSNTAFPRK